MQISEVNNITVISEYLPYVESFSLGFWFDTGSADENEKNNGISHFIEHMLFKGTGKRSAKDISLAVESLGGYLNAFTSKEHTCFYARGLKNHLPQIFDVLADMITDSKFDEKEIAKESKVILDEYYDIEDSPEELIFDNFETIIFEGNALRYPVIGKAENISSFNSEDLRKHFQKEFKTSKMLVVASGKIEHSDLEKLVAGKFSSENSFSSSAKDEILNYKKCEIREVKDFQQAHMIVGLPTVGISSAKKTAVSLLSHILGEGSSSRLFQSLREENGIAYQVNSFLNLYRNYSAFGVYISTNKNSLSKAEEIITKEFEKLQREPVSETELSRAKEYIKGQIIMGLESTSNRMHRMAQSYIYLNRIKPLDEVITEIDKVTREEIMELFGNEITLEKISKLVYLPE